MIPALFDHDHIDARVGELGSNGRPARARTDDHRPALNQEVGGDITLPGQPGRHARTRRHGLSSAACAPGTGPGSCLAGSPARTAASPTRIWAP